MKDPNNRVQEGTPCQNCENGKYVIKGWQDQRDEIFTCNICYHQVYLDE